MERYSSGRIVSQCLISICKYCKWMQSSLSNSRDSQISLSNPTTFQSGFNKKYVFQDVVFVCIVRMWFYICQNIFDYETAIVKPKRSDNFLILVDGILKLYLEVTLLYLCFLTQLPKIELSFATILPFFDLIVIQPLLFDFQTTANSSTEVCLKARGQICL